jgi:hypothetical protein
MHYVGLDVHKKTTSYCVRQADGTILQEGVIAANRQAVETWRQQLPDEWIAEMEATMFTGWTFDHLVAAGASVRVGHAAMLQGIAGGKKNDRVDARKLCTHEEPGEQPARGGHIVLEFVPGYALELNPTEYIWGHLKQHELPNFCAKNLWELGRFARHALRRMRRRPTLVASFWKQAGLFAHCHHIM